MIPPTRTASSPRAAWFNRALLLALLALGIGAAPVEGQASLKGRVVDSELGDGLSGAIVRIRGIATPLVTDTLGYFEAVAVKGGETVVTVELVGYTRGLFKLQLDPSAVNDEVFPLDFSGHRLAAVVVQARAEKLMSRYVDFERRRQRGMGAYFRWDELRTKGYSSVGDALRTVRGVKIQCNQQTYECVARMARSVGCPPVWYIDGVEAGSFHENTSIRDIYGIEIYRGSGETPGEFSGSNAACGVIVMWTKSKPFIR